MTLDPTLAADDAAPAASKRLWIAAAAGAIALHLGCVAFAMVSLQEDDPADALGAPALEISLDLAAPRAESSELPPGPDTDASAASPAVQEQKEVAKETERPKDTPTETEEADRVVSTSDSKKPKEDDPEQAAKPAIASAESAPSEATAMPTSETVKEAPKSIAPAQGVGESAQRIRATWQKQLVAHLDRHKRYPAHAARKTAQIVVGFELDRLGHIVSSHIVKGSGDPQFDEAALAMLKRSDPVPQPPPVIADEGLSFTLPVLFRVKS